MSIDIQKYLNEEKIIPRTEKEIFEEVEKHTSRENAAELNYYLLNANMQDLEFYNKVGQKVNGMAVYDYFAGMHSNTLQSNLASLLSIVSQKPKLEKILDLCTGTGLAACLLGECYPNSQITGIDHSEPMLARAIERKTRRNLDNLNFLKADRDNLPFDNQSFDIITCVNGISEGDNYGPSLQMETIRSLVMVERITYLKKLLLPQGEMMTCTPIKFDKKINEEYKRNLLDYEKDQMKNHFYRSGFYRVDTHFTEEENAGFIVSSIILKAAA